MRNPLGAALIAASVLVLVGPAAADDPAKKARSSCAFVSQIDNFKEVDDHTAIIETSPNRRFKVTFFNSCRELRWAIFARVESRPGVCLNKGDAIVVGRHGFQERCIIETIEALPPKERLTPAAQSN
jgi:Family of unknown function (DUF6491)